VRPDGLTYAAEFLTLDEEQRLLREIETLALEPVRMRGGVGKRETVHFGYDYDYEGWKIEQAPAPPEAFRPLVERCASAAGVEPATLQQLMVARYPEGATIGWHRDAPMFGSPVIGVSLLSRCEMRFRRALTAKEEGKRRKFETYAVLLEPRSLYILAGDARTKWQHSIPATPSLRYSITMRTLR
jgi:alkylated DNA repair protein (DNA oxidative demethylase)